MKTTKLIGLCLDLSSFGLYERAVGAVGVGLSDQDGRGYLKRGVVDAPVRWQVDQRLAGAMASGPRLTGIPFSLVVAQNSVATLLALRSCKIA